MEIIIERGAGLDVHKEPVVACIMGTGIKKEIEAFRTVTNDLLHLKKWLEINVAMSCLRSADNVRTPPGVFGDADAWGESIGGMWKSDQINSVFRCKTFPSRLPYYLQWS
jgi:hypothetical protein